MLSFMVIWVSDILSVSFFLIKFLSVSFEINLCSWEFYRKSEASTGVVALVLAHVSVNVCVLTRSATLWLLSATLWLLCARRDTHSILWSTPLLWSIFGLGQSVLKLPTKTKWCKGMCPVQWTVMMLYKGGEAICKI